MKLMIASDIHGSAYYCERLMKRFYEEKPDKLLLLGDILYHGPRNDLPKGYAPKKVVEMLNSIKDCTLSVRGNCEAEVDQMVLDFKILDSFDGIINDIKCHLEHGHHLDLYKGDANMIMSGHTHIPVLEKKDNIIYLNPGSITIPKGGFPRSFAVMDENKIKVLDLNKNIIFEMKI